MITFYFSVGFYALNILILLIIVCFLSNKEDENVDIIRGFRFLAPWAVFSILIYILIAVLTFAYPMKDIEMLPYMQGFAIISALVTIVFIYKYFIQKECFIKNQYRFKIRKVKTLTSDSFVDIVIYGDISVNGRRYGCVFTKNSYVDSLQKNLEDCVVGTFIENLEVEKIPLLGAIRLKKIKCKGW